MQQGERKYTDEEFGLILKKAGELSGGSDAELSIDEIRAVAAEAGLDPALIERAARLVPSQPRASLLDRALGRLTKKRLSASFAVPLTHERATHVLSSINAATDLEGRGEATSAGLTWRAGVGRVSVVMHNERGRSHVQVSDDPSVALMLGAWLGILAGWIVLGSLEPISQADFFGSVAAGVGVAVGSWATITHRARRQVDVLMDAIGRAMGEMADDAAEPEEGSRS